MEIGKMTISEAEKHLIPIAKLWGLNLNKLQDFRFARMILANRYCQ